jgi:phage protein D
VPEQSTYLSQAYVQLDGADAPADFTNDLLEVTVESSLHLPDVATVMLHDPHLKWIDDSRLAPGTGLVISAKRPEVGQAASTIFDGEIVELEPDFGPGTQKMIVRAFNRLHRLSRGRHVRSFNNVTDGDLVSKLAAEVGLQSQAGPTTLVHDYVLQRNETNLEFLRARAASLGYLVFVRGQTLHFEAPAANGQAVPLAWGETMSEFHPRLTTVGQCDGVTVRGWDPKQKQEIVGQAQNGQTAPQVGQSPTGGALAHSAFNLTAQNLITDYPIRTQAAADHLAQAAADHTSGRFIEADAVCSGNPAILAGASVSLTAVGDRFKGTYLVTSATHSYGATEGYSTRFTVTGYDPATLFGVLSPQPERALVSGFVIGVVTDNQDPDGLGRVKVKYPSFSSEHASDWVRLVVPGGGSQRGIEFVPEVNDEVLVGFELGDVHYPYVLGGLWNGQDAPPTKSDQLVSGGKVQKRIIKSRTGHIVTLDDSDGGGGITIEDSKGNKIALDTASNSLTIDVKGDATVKAQGNLSLEATGSVSVKGMGVKVDGGAATVDVKGTMINLN